MDTPKRRKGLRIILGIILIPIALFISLMVLLYIPFVQQFIRTQVTELASEATGLDIHVGRIDLRFPLNLRISNVEVEQQRDTILLLDRLEIRIQALPLFHGKVEVDEVSLDGVQVNSAHLIDGLQIQGRLERFFLESHGIDLVKNEVVLNEISLEKSRLTVALTDTTTTPEDSTSTLPPWKITLHRLNLEEIGVNLQMPLDSMQLSTEVGHLQVSETVADLNRESYGMKHLLIAGTSVKLDRGTPYLTDSLSHPRTRGLDPSHIALQQIHAEIDSAYFCGRNLYGVIRQFTLSEQSGLTVSSLTARLQADSSRIQLPYFQLLTPHSEINLSADTYWELIDLPTTSHLSTRLDARIGKQDVLLLAGDLPESFKAAYPFRPLTLRAGSEGNLKEMHISRFHIDLPGAFTLQGGGEMWHLTDSLNRTAKLNLDLKTYDLNFLTTLSGSDPSPALVIPDSMSLDASFSLDGEHLSALCKLQEGEGCVGMEAAYNLNTEQYRAALLVDRMQLHHFMPQDSIYLLTARARLEGKGTALDKPRTQAALHAALEQLQYGSLDVRHVELKGGIEKSLASVKLNSHNELLQMEAEANMRLDRRYLDGTLHMQVDQIDLHRLGIAPSPLKRPFAFGIKGEARRDSVKLNMDAGDLNLRLKARSTLKELFQRGEQFQQTLLKQIDNRRLDHAALREVLPSARMVLEAGKQNPMSYFLATKGISYNDFRFSFGFSPRRGINGRTSIHGLRSDSLQLDTIYFRISQDTARMTLQGGVINGPDNPQFVFHSTLTGEIANEDASLTANYVDGKGKTGVLFGIKARPLTEGHGKGNGLLLNLIPEEPVIAYRKFRYADKSNWIYLHKNMRVYAHVDMESDNGLSFRMLSNREDSISLQNINLELNRINLSELVSVIPYMPRITGLFSAEAHYIQTPTSLQVSAEADVRKLTYEKREVGDIALGATWLPGNGGKQYVNSYFSYNDQEVLTADGTLEPRQGKDTIKVSAYLDHFPLKIANAFIPDGMAAFSGDADGSVQISGFTEKPRVDGELALDSVTIYAKQVGARYRFDNRPVKITNNQLYFDRFAIYTTSKNPFTIDGKIDFRDLTRPSANLNLLAENYLLLDAPRTRESLVYGKALVDLNASIRGPLDALTMRGRMNLLGSTNLTYVLTDSPLTVEDRLDGLVSFTSFRDTLSRQDEQQAMLSLGGLDMLMALHIDESVRLRADLSNDRSKYIELEGGGDLNMQYSPQGDINLTGRYTLSGGTMKYSIPIIPLKEFQFAQGSYVDWRGDPMNPTLNLKATERVRASVTDEGSSASRRVNFDVSIAIKNRLEAPELLFDIDAPEDASIQGELQAMGADERNKQAITMLATGIYLGRGGGKAGGLTMSGALNSVLQSQINSLAGGVKNANISVGIEDRTNSETGDTEKDFSFKYSQRLFNDRVQIVIGGKVSTGADANKSADSFIDNVSLEYRLDRSGTRYVRAFYNKNYESILDGEITETGVGVVLRRKMDRLGELFIFKKK